jgi:hypothetical protein
MVVVVRSALLVPNGVYVIQGTSTLQSIPYTANKHSELTQGLRRRVQQRIEVNMTGRGMSIDTIDYDLQISIQKLR